MRLAITLFGSYKPRPGDAQYQLAEAIGYQLAVAGFDIINGGHEGTMAASAQGAVRGGGDALGVTCGAIREARFGAVNSYVTRVVEAPDLLSRIETMMRRASGYVILPGGTGTLAELGLVWEHVNKGIINQRPIVCVGSWWRATVETVGAAYPTATDALHFADAAEQVIAIMRKNASPPPASDRDFLPTGARWTKPPQGRRL